MSHHLSIREKQKHALKCMINLNEKDASSEPVWKLLIYDRTGQDIISPLLSVKELRDLGVTLHVSINSERDAIPEVPVIYFVLPTDENISRICLDFKNQLYDHFYLNFITPIRADKIQMLAQTAIASNVQSSVCKIFDQFSYFISLEDELFVLRESESDFISYYGKIIDDFYALFTNSSIIIAINRGDVEEEEMNCIVNSISEGLFSVFVTLNVVPIIRCPGGNAAEMVARTLDKKLRENLNDVKNNLFIPSNDFQSEELVPRSRPLLVILDRNMDMTTPLHHTWTYQALAHDVLDLKLNRVRIVESSKAGDAGATSKKAAVKNYDLNSNDKFWQQQKGSPFPQVAESVQEELESYRASEDEVKRLKSVMGLDANDEAIALLTDTTAKLNSAVSSLPELLEKKKYIDMHTTIATAILDHIKDRKLDTFFELEEKFLSKSLIDKSALDVILDAASGSPEDKMRLFLIAYLCDSGQVFNAEDFKRLEAGLLDLGCDLGPYHYIKRWKSFSKTPRLTSTANSYGGGTKTVGMFSKLMSQGSQFVMEGVKNLVPKKQTFPFTRIVDSLLDQKLNQDVEKFLTFDPKLKSSLKSNSHFSSATSPIPAAPSSSSNVHSGSFQDAVLFVVGGGNYIEYQNLMDTFKKKAGGSKKIIYGSTDLMNAGQFLAQLSRLGNEL